MTNNAQLVLDNTGAYLITEGYIINLEGPTTTDLDNPNGQWINAYRRLEEYISVFQETHTAMSIKHELQDDYSAIIRLDDYSTII
ncbi:hypothetical protein Glove_109g365 [Diversispora epigaea]|uniref:Uncharacterized protein n=1 Tax=Diversispora epigaea TaxID=1348612 RepID=A0A397J2E5_9GLOM|nr:hypothetical protein Glove_109g365 [Diversispora epigaea]